MIRVVLPHHLRTLARVGREVEVSVEGPVTLGAVLDALEAQLSDAARHDSRSRQLKRRPFVRFFACEDDLSHEPPDLLLPEAVARGTEPFLIVGAIAGG